MSYQRKMRAELRQGLHQFMMTIYQSYQSSMSHEGAIEIISNCLKEEFQYFIKDSLKNQSFDFNSLIEKLEGIARNERDSVKQHEIYEDLEALMNVKEVLAKYEMAEGS